MTLSISCAGAALTALVLAAAAPAAAQRVAKDPSQLAGDSSCYVVTVGSDTLAREMTARVPGRLDGELRLLRPQLTTLQYTLFMRADGIADSLRTVQTTGAAASRAAIDFAGDSAIVSMYAPGGTAPRVARVAVTPGTLPFINLSSGILDQIFRQARAAGGADVTVPLLAGLQPMPGRVRFIGADSAALQLNVELRATVGPDGALHAAAVPEQNVRFARVVRPAAGRREDAEAGANRYAAPAGAPYTARDVVIRTPAGIALAGTLTLPRWAAPARPAPVVVTISGSGAQNRDSELTGIGGYAIFRQLADTLGRRGVGVLRLDDRGAGASDRGPAGVTSADFADDVRAALAWLRQQPGVAAGRIGLLGHSEGGMIAPMVAADDSVIAAVVLLAAPARPGHELSAHQRRIAIATSAVPLLARDSVFRAAQAQSDSLVRSGGTDAWTRFWWTYDPLPAARRLRVPVLILHGETDMQVPVAQAEELAAVVREGGTAPVTLHRFPAVNHLFLADASGHWSGYAALPSKAVSPVIMGTVADWLAARLGVAAHR